MVLRRPVLSDFFSPDVDATGFDTFGFDGFGSVVIGSGYDGFGIEDTLSIVAPLGGPTYGDFASDAEAIDYIENHTFAGDVNIWALGNGDKITSINGSSYYMQEAPNGAIYTHTGVRNAFTAGGVPTTTSFGAYNGRGVLSNGGGAILSPLPEENLLEVLSSNSDYELFVALVNKLDLASELETGEYTVFAVNDSVFAAGTGLETVGEIQALNSESNEELLGVLNDIVSDHLIPTVNFSLYVLTLPDLETTSGNVISIDDVDGNLVILSNRVLPDNEVASIVGVDEAAANGVVHEVDALITL